MASHCREKSGTTFSVSLDGGTPATYQTPSSLDTTGTASGTIGTSPALTTSPFDIGSTKSTSAAQYLWAYLGSDVSNDYNVYTYSGQGIVDYSGGANVIPSMDWAANRASLFYTSTLSDPEVTSLFQCYKP